MSESEYKREKEELRIERENLNKTILKFRRIMELIDDFEGRSKPTTDVYQDEPNQEPVDSDEDTDNEYEEEFDEDEFEDLKDEDEG